MKYRGLIVGMTIPAIMFSQATITQAASIHPAHYEEIEFKVASVHAKAVSGARIIIVDDDGRLLSTGLTDASGKWTTKLSLVPDKRFDSKVRNLDTVAAVTIANGYNEQVLFEVPVASYMVQPITLQPIQPNRRNEPIAALGNLHRHDIMGMINKYASQLGLQKQPPIPGEPYYAPWSPTKK